MKKYGSKTIGQLINEYRKAQGISQIKLSEMVGVSYQQIQKYEKNINAISIEKLKKMAAALNIPVEKFLQPEAGVISEDIAPYSRLTNDEQAMLHLFREIKNKKLQKSVIEFMKALTEPDY
jgi:transcriptional regulator with XRE-family HTH domain